jgi:flagellar FliL protein
MSDELPKLPDAPAKKKGGLIKKLLIPLVVLVVLGGAGGWWMMRGGASAEPAEPPLESRGLLAFEPFLVNLADSGGNRFLKINVQLVLGTAEEAKHIEEKSVVLMHLRSAILELLTVQQADTLVTAEGKKALKEAIKTRVTPDLPHQKVIDVLFSEFVVQF